MRRVRIVLGLAVAVCAFGALSAAAFAKPPTLVFGEFQASVAGKTLSETEFGTLGTDKEDESTVSSLALGPYEFGTLEGEEINFEEPCAKPLKVTGKVIAEKSNELLTQISFKKCTSWSESVGKNGLGEKIYEGKLSSFTLGVKFFSNRSAEAGASEDGFEIEKGVVTVKHAQRKCTMVIPAQFIPAKAATKPNKEYEAASYSGETPEPIEKWEKSKRLKEEYPSGVKERLEIDLEEGFKNIVAYVNPAPPCFPKKGEEAKKVRTEEPYEGWVEYTKGHIEATIEGLEVKGGELTFVPPA
jgi:hypothetical protein